MRRQVAELSTAEDAAAEQARHQLQQVQARLRVLDPIMAQLDADYSGLRDSLAQLKVCIAATTATCCLIEVSWSGWSSNFLYLRCS